MVRVGGGWVALDEFLVKNDPCRGEFVYISILSNNLIVIQLILNRWSGKFGINKYLLINKLILLLF